MFSSFGKARRRRLLALVFSLVAIATPVSTSTLVAVYLASGKGMVDPVVRVDHAVPSGMVESYGNWLPVCHDDGGAPALTAQWFTTQSEPVLLAFDMVCKGGLRAAATQVGPMKATAITAFPGGYPITVVPATSSGSTDPGVAPVPLPAPVLMLAVALGGLVLLGLVEHSAAGRGRQFPHVLMRRVQSRQ